MTSSSSPPATSQGYFDNVGSTRRQGLDLAVGGKDGGFNWHVAYSFVDATFQSNFEVNGESNSTADADGNIQVRAGRSHSPDPAAHRPAGARLWIDKQLGRRRQRLIAASGMFLHGNENNANQAGGTNGEGALHLPAPAGSAATPCLICRAPITWANPPMLFVRVVNVFNKQYATAGFLTSNTFNPNGTFRADPDDWTNENAVSPAQPRAVWLGMRFRWE